MGALVAVFGVSGGWSRWATRAVASVVAAVLVVTTMVAWPQTALAATGEVTAEESRESVPQKSVPQKAEQPEAVERADGFSARFAARQLGVRVEDVSQRTESVQVFANPDGSWTAEDAGAPVRLERDGAWADVDLGLVRGADGSWSPRVAPVEVVVAGSAEEAVEVGLGEDTSLAVVWPGGELPEPVVEGGVAVFAVSESVDLVVVTTLRGANAWLRVNAPPAEEDPVFRLGLRTRGVEVQGRDGGFALVDAEGDAVGAVAGTVAWDGRTDAGGDPVRVVPVEAEVEELAGRGQEPGDGESSYELALSLPEGFWGDPDLVYPVVVDPNIAAVSKVADTWVREGTGTPQGTDYQLLVGNAVTSTDKTAFSYLKWAYSPYQGRTIVSASMNLYQYWAGSCSTSVQTMVHPLAQAFNAASTVWTNRPDYAPGHSTSFTGNKGGDACPSNPNGWVAANVTGIVTKWASGALANHGLRLNAPSDQLENANFGKRFCSFDPSSASGACKTADRIPRLSVTYTLVPNTATTPSFAPAGPVAGWTSALRPTFTTTVSDPGGDQVRATFEVRHNDSSQGLVAQCTTGLVASQTQASCQIGTNLANNGSYLVRARTTNQHGTQAASWSGNRAFQVDTSAPAQPTVTGTAYPTSGLWMPEAPSANTFTFTSNNDIVRFEYRQNTGSWTTIPVTVGTTQATLGWNPTAGAHNLTVRAVDRAGNTSAERVFTFGSGGATIDAPTAGGVKTTSNVTVSASAPPVSAGTVSPTIELRAGGGAWQTMSTLATQGTGPVAVKQTLDVSAFVASMGRSRKHTVVEVQVCFEYTSPAQRRCTWTDDAGSHAIVMYVPHAFGDNFPVADAGPGQVALWTGEFKTSATDVSIPGLAGDLSVSRTYTTYADGSAIGVFGPGWRESFDGIGLGGARFEVLDDTSFDGTITLTDLDGGALTFVQPGGGSTAQLEGVYRAVDEETAITGARLEVVHDSGVVRLVLTEPGGIVTTWTHTLSSWRVETVTETSSSLESTFSYDTDGRVIRILAPVPPNDGGTPVACPIGVEDAGCRAIGIEYASEHSASYPGDRAGQVKSVTYTAWNPDRLGGAGMDTVTVAEYAYDSAGRLVEVRDPRLDPPLVTSYQWEPAIVSGNVPLLTELVPPGLAGYTMHYEPAPGAYRSALLRVGRGPSVLGGSSAVLSAYRYDLPLSTPGLPDLSPEVVAQWEQEAAPARVFAVFDQDRADSVGSSPSAADLLHAHLHFTDDEGRTINTAVHGAGDWQYTAASYDQAGRVVRTLDVSATARIRDAVADGVPVDPDALATITRYNAPVYAPVDIPVDYSADPIASGSLLTPAGSYITDVWEPSVEISRSDGSTELVRAHLHFEYDEGAPNFGVDPATGLAFRLQTSAVVFEAPSWAGSASIDEPVDLDLPVVMQSRTGYDPIDAQGPLSESSGWLLGLPTTITLDTDVDGFGGSDDITSQTRYDIEGNTVETRQPLSAGLDGGARHSAFYTAGPQHGELAQCGERPEWAGQVCVERLGVGLSAQRKSTTRYSMYLGQEKIVEESLGTGRTTAFGYDAAARVVSAAVATHGVAGSTAIPRSSFIYDSATGAHTATAVLDSAGTELSRVEEQRDLWGRVVQYTDRDGAQTHTTYDSAGRVGQVVDPLGSTTYAYNSPHEHRGLVTSVSVTGIGTFTAEYDAGGRVATQTLPGGITQFSEYDHSGRPTQLRYDIDATPVLAWTHTFDTISRVSTVSGTATTGGTRTTSYSYDGAARLVSVDDSQDGICTERNYTFDANSNRSAMSYLLHTDDCQSEAVAESEASWTYDSFDRVLHGSDGLGTYAYDALGRQTQLPGVDTPAGPGQGDLQIGYYDDDIVRSMAQGDLAVTYERDPLGRLASSTTTTQGLPTTTTERHYANSTGAVAWAVAATAGETVTTRYASSAGGDLGAAKTGTTVTVMLSDPRGNLATTVSLSLSEPPVVGGLSHYDEYGRQMTLNPNTGTLDYAALGSSHVETSGLGIVHTGARLYNPVTGMFTSPDPVEGGNATAYGYPTDPINAKDADGRAAAAVAVVPLAVILLIALFAYALYLALREYITRCTISGCGISIPDVSISWPNPKAASAKKYKNTVYLVYEIFRIKGKVTFKYGITRVGPKRPRSQLGICRAYFRSDCDWREIVRVKGWFQARTREVTLIAAYYARHGHCPPGQLFSCR